MNIVHVIESLEFGGAEKVVIQLAERFSLDNCVSIVTTKRAGDLAKIVSNRVSQYYLNCAEGNDPTVIFKLRKLFIINKTEIVHIHNWGVYVEAVIAAKLAGVKHICHTIHGPYRTYDSTFKEQCKKYLRHTVEKALALFVNHFIAVSDAVRNYVIHDIGVAAHKIHVIRNGVKPVAYNPEKNLHSAGRINLVSIGRIARIKNHRFMLDGLKLAVDNNVKPMLTIVGDGPELDNIKNYVMKLGLNKYVIFLGFRTDIENILEDKDIFIMTSDYEGISIAMLEAMRVGIPVIATNVGGIPETVKDGVSGILVDTEDTHSLSNAIQLLHNNQSTRLEMGQRSYEHFMAEFNEDAVILKYDNLYRSATP